MVAVEDPSPSVLECIAFRFDGPGAAAVGRSQRRITFVGRFAACLDASGAASGSGADRLHRRVGDVDLGRQDICRCAGGGRGGRAVRNKF